MNTDTHFPLVRAIPELISLTGKAPNGGYEALARMARNGTLRTEYVRGRYYVQRSDLPAIAEQLGLIGDVASTVTT
ncbi:MAG: hypothetical protein ACRYF2_12835 [Janthinobacterium lividum]